MGTVCCIGREGHEKPRQAPAGPGCLLGTSPRNAETKPDSHLAQALFSLPIRQEELDNAFRSDVLGHVHGIHTASQFSAPCAAERETAAFGEVHGAHFACQKGFKDEEEANQDNFSVTRFKSGHTLACVCDGHGRCGHKVSERIVQTLPFLLLQQLRFDGTLTDADIEQGLVTVFNQAHKDVVAHAAEAKYDASHSGATAVVALFKDNEIWTAHVGDSKVVIGSEEDESLVHASQDHTPDRQAETERIQACGGEVRTPQHADGALDSPRVYVGGSKFPGLAMARCLGDDAVKKYGIIAEPEVSKTTVDPCKKPFVFLATDGVWQFMDADYVAHGIARMLKQVSADGVLKRVQELSHDKWGDNTDYSYCDDITSLLIFPTS